MALPTQHWYSHLGREMLQVLNVQLLSAAVFQRLLTGPAEQAAVGTAKGTSPSKVTFLHYCSCNFPRPCYQERLIQRMSFLFLIAPGEISDLENFSPNRLKLIKRQRQEKTVFGSVILILKWS